MTIKKILIPLLCFIVPWSLESAVTNVQKQEAYKKARDAYNDTDIASKQRLIEAFNALSEPQKKAVAGKLPKPINAIMADVTAAKAAVIIKAAPATPPADATVEAEVQEFIDNAKFILNLVKKPDAETDITGLQDYQEMLNKNIESLKTYKTTLGSLAASGTKTLILNELTTLETRLTTQLSQVSARITTLTASAPAPTEAAVKQGVEAALADLTDEEKAKISKVLERRKGKAKVEEAQAKAADLRRIKSQISENRGIVSLTDSSPEGIAQAETDLAKLRKTMPDFTKLINGLDAAIKRAKSAAPAPTPGPAQTSPGAVQTPEEEQEVEHQRAVLTALASDIRAADAILSSQTAQTSAIDNNLQQLEQAKKTLEDEVTNKSLGNEKNTKMGEIQELINRLNKKKVALALLEEARDLHTSTGSTSDKTQDALRRDLADVIAMRHKITEFNNAQLSPQFIQENPVLLKNLEVVETDLRLRQETIDQKLEAPAPKLPQLTPQIPAKSQEISNIEKAVRKFKKVPGTPESIKQELDKATNAVIFLEAQKNKTTAVQALLEAATKARDELGELLKEAESTSGIKGALAPAREIPGVVQATAPVPAPKPPKPVPAPKPAPAPAPAPAAAQFADFTEMKDDDKFSAYMSGQVDELINNKEVEKAKQLLPLAEARVNGMSEGPAKVATLGAIDTIKDWLNSQ